MFVNVTSQRVDITDRNVVIASVPRGAGGRQRSPAVSRIEIKLDRRRNVRDVQG